MHHLTEGRILKKKEIKEIFTKKFNQIKLTDSNYYLMVINVTKEFTKITIYPIETPPILKIILNGSKLEQMHILNVTKKIIESQITLLHTSGIVAVKESYIDEIYLKSDENRLKSFTTWLFSKKMEFQIEIIEESWFKN